MKSMGEGGRYRERQSLMEERRKKDSPLDTQHRSDLTPPHRLLPPLTTRHELERARVLINE
jgi:hypothetical protein